MPECKNCGVARHREIRPGIHPDGTDAPIREPAGDERPRVAGLLLDARVRGVVPCLIAGKARQVLEGRQAVALVGTTVVHPDDGVNVAAVREHTHTLGKRSRGSGVDTFVTVGVVRRHGLSDSIRKTGSGVSSTRAIQRPEEPVFPYHIV